MLLKTQKGISLQDILANLELLYIKAKNYHWNVTGPEFRPLHKTFDELQELALDWADTIAERMRALDIHVDASAESYLRSIWFDEVVGTKDAQYMKSNMSATLEKISKNLNACITSRTFDEVTSNKLQDLCHDIDKQNYFIKSAIITKEVRNAPEVR